MKFSHNASNEFRHWAIPYYSWVEDPSEQDIESHEMAWNACKLKVLEILNKEKVNSLIIKQIEKI